MKKKGLIISTVVMAVVLIASLTTATYAWFSSSANASIDQIEMKVEAASNVRIGLLKTGQTVLSSETSYVSGDVSNYASATSSWGEGNEGLGSSISTGINLSITAGVGSTTGSTKAMVLVDYADIEEATSVNGTYTWTSAPTNYYRFDETAISGTHKYYVECDDEIGDTLTGNYYELSEDDVSIDPTYVPQSALSALKTASGTSYATLTVSPDAAIVNTEACDVVDLKMGIAPSKEKVYGTLCAITVNAQGAYWGMAAALKADISVGNGSKTACVDLFDLPTTDIHWNTKTSGTSGEVNSVTFYFIIDEITDAANGMPYKPVVVKDFSIRLFVDGNDSDCIADATGYNATINLDFYGIEKKDSKNIITIGTTEVEIDGTNDLVEIELAPAA